MTADAELEAALEKRPSVGRPLMEEQLLVELEARFGRPLARQEAHLVSTHQSKQLVGAAPTANQIPTARCNNTRWLRGQAAIE